MVVGQAEVNFAKNFQKARKKLEFIVHIGS